MGTIWNAVQLQNMRDVYVWAHMGILDTHKTHQGLHIWAQLGIRVARFVLVGHPWAPPWAPYMHVNSGLGTSRPVWRFEIIYAYGVWGGACMNDIMMQ